MSKPALTDNMPRLDPATVILFSRRGSKSWVAAVDRFHETTQAICIPSQSYENVVQLRPGVQFTESVSAYRETASALIDHDERPAHAEPGIIRLLATLMGERDPAWLLPAGPATANEAVWLAAYRSALRRNK